MKNYELLADGQAIKCLRCKRVSWHPEDVKQLYCGWCKIFHKDPPPKEP